MARRLAGIASTALITAGLVVLVDVGVTLAWSEPVSTLQGWLAQRDAADELESLEREFRPRPGIVSAGWKCTVWRTRPSPATRSVESRSTRSTSTSS